MADLFADRRLDGARASLMVTAQGWCMVRGSGRPFVVALAEWLALPVYGYGLKLRDRPMGTKISIVAGEAPASVRVEQPGEKPHVRAIEPGSGYDFELIGQGAVFVGGDIRPIVTDQDQIGDEIERAPGEPLAGDDTNQRPSPDAKPDAGQTSETSELQPEADAVSRSRASRKTRDE